jgi:ribonuclease-3
VLADTLEAVLGAVFLDCRQGDTDAYKSVIIKLFAEAFSEAASAGTADFKTMLQQFIEKDGSAFLEYEIVEQSGPEHRKKFTVAAKVNNNITGIGVAFSKKDAEMKAAKKALELFGYKF